MAVRPIRLFGDPVLRQQAVPVTDFGKELRRLVRDLTETMTAAYGSGLAAPQIGVGLRVFTYQVDGAAGHLVNPRLTELSDEEQDDDEGCLSFPGVWVPTRRALRVVAEGFDQHGEPVRVAGGELLARALQHETDHLDGILFIDRLDKQRRREAMRLVRQAEWAGWDTPQLRLSPHPTGGKAL